ncbi:MAG: hypothetical protein HY706_14925 [Candidatus Hydrogenedentes bacterium]|nr:hypothetical protein [Candidatus Hydrogenedentota bacterium]
MSINGSLAATIGYLCVILLLETSCTTNMAFRAQRGIIASIDRESQKVSAWDAGDIVGLDEDRRCLFTLLFDPPGVDWEKYSVDEAQKVFRQLVASGAEFQLCAKDYEGNIVQKWSIPSKFCRDVVWANTEYLVSLVFERSGTRSLWVRKLDTGQDILLEDNWVWGPLRIGWVPRWLAKDRLLIFTGDPIKQPNEPLRMIEVMVPSGHVQILYERKPDPAEFYYSPHMGYALSPDKQFVAFWAPAPNGEYGIVSVHLPTREVSLLAPFGSARANTLAWTPSGKRLYYSRANAVYAYDLGTRQSERITDFGKNQLLLNLGALDVHLLLCHTEGSEFSPDQVFLYDTLTQKQGPILIRGRGGSFFEVVEGGKTALVDLVVSIAEFRRIQKQHKVP